MTLRKVNQRVFHRALYRGISKTVELYKRNVDQQEGTIVKYKVFNAVRFSITKTGEPIANDESVDHRARWMIPRSEMDRLGLTDINVLDRIRETSRSPNQVRWWQPEATTTIEINLMENYIFSECLRVDPQAETQ